MQRIPALDALRGWAILLVIAVHTSHLFFPTSATVKGIATHGNTGVFLFFVVSAFSLKLASDNWTRDRPFSASHFYLRRIVRIWPMLWVAMAYFLWSRGTGPVEQNPDGVGIIGILLTAIGANGWHPLLINSIIPVGWTIGVEMSFYLIFPLLFFWITSLPRALIAFVVSDWISLQWRDFASAYLVPEFSQTPQHIALTQNFISLFSLPSCLIAFVGGFVVYYTWKAVPPSWTGSVAALAISIVMYAMLVTAYYNLWNSYGYYTIMMSCFALALIWKPITIFDNPVTQWIGKVSYSAYLLHLAVIWKIQAQPWAMAAYPMEGDGQYLIAFVVVTAITVAISSVTYALIERPFMRWGATRSKQATTAPA